MQASLANPLFSTDASRPARAASSAGLRPVALAVLTLLAAPALAQTSAPLQLQASGVQLGLDYPHTVVSNAAARERTLMRFHFMRASTT